MYVNLNNIGCVVDSTLASAKHSFLFVLNAAFCVLSREAADKSFIIFVMRRHAGARTNIYHTRCEGANYYITDAAKINSDSK
jgi:hypothetical protein